MENLQQQRSGAVPDFPAAIDRLTRAEPAAVLTDGASSCSYGELPGHFAALDELVRERRADTGHCLALCGYVDQHGAPWDDGAEPRLDGESWFRTGDLAKIPVAGDLTILGRCDLSVNRDGLLVPFADVEAAIAHLDGIEQAAIASHGRGKRGQRIVAFCVLAQGAYGTAEEVRRRCFALPAHMIPDEVVIIDTMPTLPNGKIDRLNLSSAASRPRQTLEV